MARRQANKRKRFELPAAVVALCVVGGVASASWVGWDAYSCEAELEEATGSLMKILELEQVYKAKTGAYAPMEPCSFHPDGDVCASRIGFSILGESRFAYRVELTEEGFEATAVGAGGRHFGSVLRIDDTGQLDARGALCAR